MKFSTYLLSLYILLLSCVPCADTPAASEAILLQEQLTAINVNHEHSSCPEDDCSPFCSCECCHSQVVIYATIQVAFELNTPHLPTKTTFYLTSYSSSYFSSILDPPELMC